RRMPPLLTTNWLPPPSSPSQNPSPLLHTEPESVTNARLLLAATFLPTMTKLSCTVAPPLTTNRLNAPLLPTLRNVPPTCQRALGLSNRTSLDLAVALKPMVAVPELVSN